MSAARICIAATARVPKTIGAGTGEIALSQVIKITELPLQAFEDMMALTVPSRKLSPAIRGWIREKSQGSAGVASNYHTPCCSGGLWITKEASVIAFEILLQPSERLWAQGEGGALRTDGGGCTLGRPGSQSGNLGLGGGHANDWN